MLVRALAVGLVLLALSSGASAQSRTSRLAGSVQSAAGRPVSGAEVVLQSPAGTERMAVANEEGAFQFENVAPGEYRLFATAVGFSPAVQALTLDPERPATFTLVLPDVVSERIHVVADASAVDRVPGSTQVLDRREMSRLRIATDDVHRMLRQVPGLNVQEEEGYGLRPNIGMRGTGTDRSSKITLMEDGVLVAPAPYAAPAAYYAPVPGRMESIEVRKGSSQIKYGPITTGGVLNYVSTAIPDDFRIRADMTGGSDDLRRASVTVGDSYRNVGWMLETYQLGTDGFKRLDGGGETGVRVEDYLAKVRFNTTPSLSMYQAVEVKLGRTEQDGDETYLGLTDGDFLESPLRRYAASQADVFRSTHEQYQVRHLLARRTWDLTTVVYRNDFHRSWYKLQSVLGSGLPDVLAAPQDFAAQMAVLTGGDSPANALVVRDNNRTYSGAGVQSVLGLRRRTGVLAHALEIGFRYHRDEEDRFQHDDRYQMAGGRMILTQAGAPGSQTNQVVSAAAVAGFLADTIAWNRWTFSPGVRLESIDLRRVDFATSDPARSAPTGTRDLQVNVAVPGVGVNYAAVPGALAIFGGVHKGFAPPAPGAAQETEPEQSINYELGVRVTHDGLNAEVVGFVNDYSNLLGRDTLSTGGSGDGDLFNGGAALVRGLEASARWNILQNIAAGIDAPVRVAYTYTQAEFRNSFESSYAPWGTVATGDRLPYLSPHQLFASLDVEGRAWRARLDATRIGRMRTIAGQGPYEPGRTTDASLVFGASGEYTLGTNASVYASIQNLADRRYLVSRHPAGVRPGLPRTVMVGLRFAVGD